MTTLPRRPHTALVVVDVQKGVAEAHRRDDVVANIRALVDKARGEGVPIVWVQHSDENLGSDAWELAPGGAPLVDIMCIIGVRVGWGGRSAGVAVVDVRVVRALRSCSPCAASAPGCVRRRRPVGLGAR